MSVGIVIAANAAYEVELPLLIASIQRVCSYQIAVYDLGLSAAQRASCECAGVQVCEAKTRCPDPIGVMPEWPHCCCWKPALLETAPFDRVLWLDADTIVLDDPTPLLEHARKHVCAVVRYQGTSHKLVVNRPELYTRFPTKISPTDVALNAGVFAVDIKRAAPLFQAWRAMVARGHVDHELRKLIAYDDQGSLLWALHALGWLDCIVDELGWNASANGLCEREGAVRKTYRNDATLIVQLKADHPGAHIIHWYWEPKLRQVLSPRVPVAVLAPTHTRVRGLAEPRSGDGIIAAADAGYYPQLVLLVRSLRAACRYPVMVVDGGLTVAQVAALRADGVTVVPLPSSCAHLPRPIVAAARKRLPKGTWSGALAWRKPFQIRDASPYRRSLWLDVDTIVLDDVAPLFAYLDRGPVMFRETQAGWGAHNDPRLYERFPVPVPLSGLTVNAGVIGLDQDRDAPLLRAWCEMVRRALADPEILDLVQFDDEGALLWALHATGQIGAISDETSWNYSADGQWTAPVGRWERRRYVDDETLFEQIREAHPGKHIVHWIGQPKLTDTLDQPRAVQPVVVTGPSAMSGGAMGRIA